MFNNIISASSNSSVGGIALIIIFTAVLLLLTYAAIFIIAKYHKVEKDNTLTVGKLKTIYVLLIILGVGLIARIIFVFFVNGFGSDYSLAYSVAYAFKTNGSFANYTTDYLGVGPLLGYVYMIFGNMGLGLNLSKDAIGMQFFIKLPYIISDIACLFLLYFVTLKYTNGYVALGVSSLYFLNPIFITLSSIWGSPVALYVLVLFLIAYFVLEKNVFGMVMSTVVGLLMDIVFIFPAIIVLAYCIYLFVLSIIKIISVKPTMETMAKDNTLSNVYYVPVCLALGVMLIYLLSLPAFFADGVGAFSAVYDKLFIAPVQFNTSIYSLSYFANNSLNIFTIFLQNGVEIGNKFPTAIYTAVMLAIAVAVMLLTFLSKKNRANLVLIISYVVATIGIYYVGTNAWSIAPAIICLLLAFVVIKDKRILHVFAILSFLLTINGLLVLIGSGQVGALLVEGEFFLKDDELLNVFSILFSVLTVLVHIYFTVVALDISLTKNRHIFNTNDTSSFGDCIRNLYRNN